MTGMRAARIFQKLLALVFLDAWLSLAAQKDVLIGSHGLTPAAEFVAAVHQAGLHFWNVPTLFLFGAPDWALSLGAVVGILLSLAALAGFWPRVMFGLATLLYLSFVVVGRTFFSFQWDNLLLECGFFAIFLPTDREAPLMQILFRLILFKLYWESGVAKWQSQLRDWQDGSAMTYYYETAPLPAALAWYAHFAPVWWHHLESWGTLAFELVLPFGAFVPIRRVRQFVAGFLTAFQIINALTANYGFFCYLACALHIFLLADLSFAGIDWKKAFVLVPFVFLSTVQAVNTFGRSAIFVSVEEFTMPFRLVNTYHLFGSITRERIEAEFQTQTNGQWTAHDFYYKPGPLHRRPPYVAPHQPRVDFQLWFYGLAYQRHPPPYVVSLLQKLCEEPSVVQPLFTDPLPQHPDAVRMVYWQYHFSTEKYWSRVEKDETRPISCASIPK